ncbi:MAG: M23 family metallopeptidase [Bacteroidales bacterium]|nr:M23 family metallopeptidase [Bacteroidales bacterium]
MDKAEKKARNLRLTLLDAASHERLWSLRFSRTHMIVAAISSVVAVLVAVFCLIAYTPIRTFIPGYPNAQSRRQAVQNAQRIDSLQTRILQWELYTENLRRVVSGEEPIRLDTLMLGQEGSRSVSDARYLAIRDSLLRADVVQEEQFGLTSVRRQHLPIEALAFYTPVKGVVSTEFNQILHPWVDITAPVGSTVMAVLDGTVVYTDWAQDSGYTLVLQHGNDLLSIYKHNQKLLHKTGDAVKAGTPVAMLASSSSLTKGDHLHFELWYKGTAVDPVRYIKF